MAGHPCRYAHQLQRSCSDLLCCHPNTAQGGSLTPGSDVQAATFAGAAEGEEEPPEAHPILTRLRGQMSDDAQYAAVSHILRRMLHPHVQQRATIKEVLAADLFTKY